MQHGACFPELRKQALAKRGAQVRRAFCAAGAAARADDALDHLNVSQPPSDHQFVEFRQPLAEINPVAIAALVLVDIANRLGALLKALLLGGVWGEGRERTDRGQRVEEYVVQRWCMQPAFQPGVGFGIGGMMTQELFVFEAAEKLDFAELLRLEAAGRL